MRQSLAGRWVCWFLLIAGLGAGCQSVSPVSSRLGSNAPTSSPQALAAKIDAKDATEVAWKPAGVAPSTALTQDQWASSGTLVRPIGFQTEPAPLPEVPATPEIMLKDAPPAKPVNDVPVKTTSFSRHGKHADQAVMTPLPNAPTEMNQVLLPTYIIRSPDVLLIESQKGLLTQPIRGQHLVRPDGTVGLGIYGPVVVAGLTIQQAREELARAINTKIPTIEFKDILHGLSVDVLAYNSSVYYVITDGAGLGEAVYRFPITGNETVLDAISNINGLPVMSSPKRIWVARRNVGPTVHDTVLPVNWLAITRGGSMETNWQIMPGDRVFVQADPMRRFNNNLGKFLEPIERLLGATLLGGQAVNTIKTGQVVP